MRSEAGTRSCLHEERGRQVDFIFTKEKLEHTTPSTQTTQSLVSQVSVSYSGDCRYVVSLSLIIRCVFGFGFTFSSLFEKLFKNKCSLFGVSNVDMDICDCDNGSFEI